MAYGPAFIRSISQIALFSRIQPNPSLSPLSQAVDSGVSARARLDAPLSCLPRAVRELPRDPRSSHTRTLANATTAAIAARRRACANAAAPAAARTERPTIGGGDGAPAGRP